MPATAKGIYHNLKESNYTVSNTEIVFFFSSELYLNKFLNGYEAHRELFRTRFNRMCNTLYMNTDTLADIQFYGVVEKRGFRVTVKGSDVEWQEIERYALHKMTDENTLDWSRIQKPRLAERLKDMESTSVNGLPFQN